MTGVFLIDDHCVVREALSAMIAARPGWEVVGGAGGGHEGVRRCAALQPDVILLDYGLPDLDGVETARQLLAASPQSRILVLTMCENADVARRMLALGVSGYVVKSAPSEQLSMALEKVARGQRYVTPTVMEGLLDGIGSVTDAPPEASLTERELQVLQRLAVGMNAAEVGDALSIAPSTVETYRARLKAKLDLHTTADIVRFAVRRGLVEP